MQQLGFCQRCCGLRGKDLSCFFVNEEKNEMAKYIISTDDGTMVANLDELSEALARFGAPAGVVDADTFRDWLNSVGGWGHIDVDGERICEVAKT